MGARVLVVDDELEVRRLLAHVCARHPQVDSVTQAQDALTALEAIREARAAGATFDLVVSDHSMPRMTGFEMMDTLRASGTIIPGIMVSGEPSAMHDAAKHGFDWALMKPFRLADMIQTLDDALATTVTGQRRPESR